MINYELIRKKNMKRIVLRVKDGIICVSAPPKVPKYEIDKFVQSKTSWIQKHINRPPSPLSKLKHFNDDACFEKFNEIAKDVYPLIAHRLKTQPEMRIKDYKSRWGVCYCKRGYIILNKQLFDKPKQAIEYVILHEYVHFLVQNHGERFHEIMTELMPDYKARAKKLRT